MAAERPTRRSSGKPGPRRTGSAKAKPELSQPVPENRYVDVDPWAMLAELMELPDEEPVARTRPKRK